MNEVLSRQAMLQGALAYSLTLVWLECMVLWNRIVDSWNMVAILDYWTGILRSAGDAGGHGALFEQ